MKKNILLLINGFGVSQSGSYEIYDGKLMPNMDRFTKEKLFTSLDSKDLDYKSGYRNFSIGINESLSYSVVENSLDSGKYLGVENYRALKSVAESKKGKIHIFCFWENDRTIEQLLTYLRDLNTIPQVKVFVHLVFCQKSLADYKNMDNIITKVNYEYGDMVKIGIVTGENYFTNYLNMRNVFKTFISEMGEKWRDITKKLDVLISTRATPNNARTFSMSEGYRLENNDTIFFFNYNNIDVDKFIKEFTVQKYKKFNMDTIHFFSLFPTKSEQPVPFLFNFAVSSSYAAASLKSINAKCLILDTKEKCPYINYYFTGLRNNVDPLVNFMATDDGFIYDKDKVIDVINKYNHDLIIINYEIDSCKSVEEIEDRLRKIDTILGALGELVEQKDYALFVSSLYGIETELYNDKHELCKINFCVRVPLVVIDNKCTKRSHFLGDGTVFDLANTLFENINKKFKGESLLRRKAGLLSFLYKKPRG